MSADPAITPLDPNFKLSLPNFEGPLDLLLHLIRKHELDIVELPIAFITERYLHYISLMRRLDLDIAAEYLVMAATLAHIKSKMLLPPDPHDAEHDEDSGLEEGDPRAELIHRLLEYQKYKQAAQQLGARELPGRDIFTRGASIEVAPVEPDLAPVSVFKLLDAVQHVLKRLDDKRAFSISAERISIQDCIQRISDRLESETRCSFESLLEQAGTRYDIVVTLLAILEMTKTGLLGVYQAGYRNTLYIQGRTTEAPDSTSVEHSSEL